MKKSHASYITSEQLHFIREYAIFKVWKTGCTNYVFSAADLLKIEKQGSVQGTVLVCFMSGIGALYWGGGQAFWSYGLLKYQFSLYISKKFSSDFPYEN